MRTNKCATFALKSLCVSLGLACAGMSYAADLVVGEDEVKEISDSYQIAEGEKLNNAGTLTISGDLVGGGVFNK